jgi:selenocysteine-specific elongation factor
LIGIEELLPGQEAWLQLELQKPVVAVRGDRYILRRPSPGETLGGGFVVDHQPKGRHKRFAKTTLASLEALTQGSPADILLEALNSLGIAPLQNVIVRSNLQEEAINNALQELMASHQLVLVDQNHIQEIPRQSLVASRAYWDQLIQSTIKAVDTYHLTYPLRRGLFKEELKSKLKASSRWFPALLRDITAEGLLEEDGTVLKRKGYKIQFTPAQQHMVEALMVKFKSAPYNPPTVKECIAAVKEDVYNALVDLGELIPIPPDVVFRRQDYNIMVETIIKMLKERGTLTAAQVRDHFNTSRRYVLAVLENLDAQGVTLRDGDLRRLKKA